ncbi:integrase, catalytic region, zinc finger, CCHC-type containing protein [Tanacetum coccineum]
MSTSNTHQQSLADVGSETRPLMLKRGSYIPWSSCFRRYLNRKRENIKWLNKAIDEGPYEFKEFTPSETEPPRMQKEEDLKGDDLKHYEAEIEAMNLILISIPNDVYNSVDACTTAQAMWQRVERLMRGTIQNKVDRETRFNNEFNQFVSEPGGSLVSVYNRFAQLMNDLERNDIKFSQVTINTKFLNYLQPEWLKNFGNDGRNTRRSYVQEEVIEGTVANVQCNDCREKGHYARNCPKPRFRDSKYFMEQMLLAKHDEAGVILTDEQNDFLFADASRMEEIEELSANICLMARIQPTNFDSSIGPSYDSAFLSEDQAMILHFSVRYKLHPPVIRIHYLLKITKNKSIRSNLKLLQHNLGVDQIDSNIIFDEPNGDVNSGSVEYDNNVQESYELEQLAKNAYKEAEKQQIIAKKVQEQNIVLTKQLESYKEKVWVFEMTKGNNTTYFNEYIKADRKAKRFEQDSQS